MAKHHHARIFLASPGDVEAERHAARACLDRVPREAPFAGRVTLEIVAWDDPYAPVPMSYRETPRRACSPTSASHRSATWWSWS